MSDVFAKEVMVLVGKGKTGEVIEAMRGATAEQRKAVAAAVVEEVGKYDQWRRTSAGRRCGPPSWRGPRACPPRTRWRPGWAGAPGAWSTWTYRRSSRS
ncbi:hypothetical protein ACFQX7_11110 [Luedemannella flava]